MLDVNLKHPVLLPRDGFVTNLITKFCHERAHHAGRGMTLNEVQNSEFWVLHSGLAVQKFISQCVLCRLMRGKSGEQKMSDLLSDRMQEVPPFTYCAVDYFRLSTSKIRERKLNSMNLCLLVLQAEPYTWKLQILGTQIPLVWL